MTKWLHILTIFAKTQKKIAMNTLVAISSIPTNSVYSTEQCTDSDLRENKDGTCS